MTTTTVQLPHMREALVRRSFRLNVVTLAYNSLEGVVAIVGGLLAGASPS